MTVYPASFFVSTAAVLCIRHARVLPGYEFSESDADVRGFAGAAGNVLIDGSRPAGKQDRSKRSCAASPPRGRAASN